MAKKMTPEEKKAHMDDITALRQELNEASDRAFVIVWSVYLDEKLSMLIPSFLVEGKVTKELFNSYHPISTFSAKNCFAFYYGFVKANTMQ